ncbi:FtsX-like permease family protein [Dolosigranulum pigrum]|uniref:FtsX-like permease family protein n=1 Tax=Dolosigranulum pigrum TaxID=29394 RepID=UPI001AD861D0|nr:FtsX-like permease family protein [Dolosigranulum pigrum]QTJ51338.1 FtsX-like permease family protein [Dolosigranulum pigrum]
MKLSALWKDTFREVRGTLSRFLSIFAIIFLGVAFFAGLVATGPVMMETSDAYYKEHNLADMQVLSTGGLVDEDIERLEAVEHAVVEPGYMLDVLIGDNQAVRLFGINDDTVMNQYNVQTGRLPESVNEIALDRDLASDYELGDTVQLVTETTENYADHIDQDTFELVGFVDSPLYIEMDNRGYTTIGTGVLNGFGVVQDEVFNLDQYSMLNAQFQDIQKFAFYSDDYEQQLAQRTEMVEEAFDGREEERLAEIKVEADADIAKARDEIEAAKQELNAAEQELLDAREELDQGWADYEAGRQELERKERDAEMRLQTARNELATGRERLSREEARLRQGELQLQEASARLNRESARLAKAEQELEAGREAFRAGQAELADAEDKLARGRQEFQQEKAAAEGKLTAGERELAQKRAELDAGAEALAAAREAIQVIRPAVKRGEVPDLSALPDLDRLAGSWLDKDQLQAELDALNIDAEQLEYELRELEAALAQLIANAPSAETVDELIELAPSLENDANMDSQTSESTAEANSTNLTLPVANAEQPTKAMAEFNQEKEALELRITEVKKVLAAVRSQIEEKHGQLPHALDQAAWRERVLAWLAEKETELDQREAELETGRRQLAKAEQELTVGRQQMKAELSEARRELEAGEREVRAGRQELAEKEAELANGERQLASGRQQLTVAQAELSRRQDQVTTGWEQLQAGRAKLAAGEAELTQREEAAHQQLAEAEAELMDARTQLEAGEADYTAGRAEYETEEESALNEIEEAEADIAQGEEDLADLEVDYTFNNALSFPGLSEYGENAERMQSIATIFPVFFVLLALLISLTTMSRMVSEGRTQIGTMKSLGYSNTLIGVKYYIYAFVATIAGSIGGLWLGFWLFPTIVMEAYTAMYRMIPAQTRFYGWISLISVIGALLATGLATHLSLRSLLRQNAATLLRPKAPKVGQRNILEHIPALWNRLSFTQKVSARNLFRYKGRMIMTIIGVSGGVALLLAGFGLADSISDIGDRQFNQVYNYDALVQVDTDESAEHIESLEETLLEQSLVRDVARVKQKNITIEAAKQYDGIVLVPENVEVFDQFIHLYDADDRETIYQLDDEQVIISEKLSELTAVEVGDELTVLDNQDEPQTVIIGGIVEHYVDHYVYMSPTLYEQTFGETPDFDARFVQYDSDASGPEADEESFRQQIAEEPAALAIILQSDIFDLIETSLGSLEVVTMVLIVSAGALAFIVLYNLTNINVSERVRELSTIKVLGFFDKEVTTYVYRETLTLTIMGIIVGMGTGIILNRFILDTAELDFLMFVREIHGSSYLYATLLMLGFSMIVMTIMHFKLKHIDMLEALKTKD